MNIPVLDKFATREFNENGLKAEIKLTIYGLRTGRKLTSGLKKMPTNAKVIRSYMTETSCTFVLQMEPEKSNQGVEQIRQYSFCVQRLPTLIEPKETKIIYEDEKVILRFLKKSNEAWRPFEDDDFETDLKSKSNK